MRILRMLYIRVLVQHYPHFRSLSKTVMAISLYAVILKNVPFTVRNYVTQWYISRACVSPV